MINYIIHPYTKEVQREENYQMFDNWQRIQFIKGTAAEEEQDDGNGNFVLTVTLEDGTVKTAKLKHAEYFDGKNFYLN